jgi:hypothetical protein
MVVGWGRKLVDLLSAMGADKVLSTGSTVFVS